MKGWVKILIGLVAGIAFGLVASNLSLSLAPVGTIFIDLLKMLVGILIFASIVSGICQINDPKKLGRIGLRTVLFYLITTVIATSVGIGAGYLFKPGASLHLASPLRYSQSRPLT